MSSTTREDFVVKEQETFRLALIGDAISIAASAVFFAVRLVDSTFDLNASASFRVDSPDVVVKQAAAKIHTFLEFKASEELRSMAMSLVFPLLLVRILGSLKDAGYSMGFRDGNTTRRVLDGLDATVVGLTAVGTLITIPLLEFKMRELAANSSADAPWEKAVLLETFEELQISHLVALAQAGLLMLLSLLKLSARLERASLRLVERAIREDRLEEARSNGGEEIVLENGEEILMEETEDGLIVLTRTDVVTVIATTSSMVTEVIEEVPDDEGEDVVLLSPQRVLNDNTSGIVALRLVENTTASMDSSPPPMSSPEFFEDKGWRRLSVPVTKEDPATSPPKHEDDEHSALLEGLLGLVVGVVTFLTVLAVHDPLKKMMTAR